MSGVKVCPLASDGLEWIPHPFQPGQELGIPQFPHYFRSFPGNVLELGWIFHVVVKNLADPPIPVFGENQSVAVGHTPPTRTRPRRGNRRLASEVMRQDRRR